MAEQIPIPAWSPLAPHESRPGAEAATELVAGTTMLPPGRLQTLYGLGAYCETAALPGAIVQCGVWKGGAAAVLARAGLDHGAGARPLHLFDAYDDICEPDEAIDGERAVRESREQSGVTGPLRGRLRALRGVYDRFGGHGTVPEARTVVVDQAGYDAALVHFHLGWFQDTVAEAAPTIGPVALLHLDADFYAGTKLCLETFWAQVVPGGLVVIDDYATYDGCRAAVDEFLAQVQPAHLINWMDEDARYVIKR
ncbi:MAG: TylF/MycF/NovP-related O-methyltransferase [Solirubrobacteraceae bacterium]